MKAWSSRKSSPRGRACAAGLEEDMVLTHVAGRRVTTIADCLKALEDRPPGQDVTVAIRGHEDVIVRVVE